MGWAAGAGGSRLPGAAKHGKIQAVAQALAIIAMTLFSSSTLVLKPGLRRLRMVNWLGRVVGMGLVLFWANPAIAQTNEWKDNLTRAQVISALGQPLTDAQIGNSETITYVGGLRIQLQRGMVTDISGAAVPASLKPAPAPAPVVVATPAATVAPAPSVLAPTLPTAAPLASTSPSTASASAPSTPSGGDAAANDDESAKIINDFSTSTILPKGVSVEDVMKNPKKLMMGGDPDAPEATAESSPTANPAAALAAIAAAPPSDWSQPNTLLGFFAGLLIKTVLMTVVLKGVFMYKDFPVLWIEVALVAFGVSLTNQILAFLFTLNSFGEIAKLVQADQLVAAVVLLALIMNFTAAKQLPTAVGITVVAMSANVAIGYALLFLT
jgi:hypothetical protein